MTPGDGRHVRAANSMMPNGHGRRGARLPIASTGRIVNIAASEASRPPRLGPSSTTSTGARSLTGYLRARCTPAGLMPARWYLGTLLGAVIATTSYVFVVLGVLRHSDNPGNLAWHPPSVQQSRTLN